MPNEEIQREYQIALEAIFHDICDIFMFKRKYGSEVEKAFVDYWFGIFPGETSNSEEELIKKFKKQTLEIEKTKFTLYDILWRYPSKIHDRWETFAKYGIYKDEYQGKGNTQGNLILDIPLPDGGISETAFSCHTDTVHRTDGFQNITYTASPENGYIIQSDNNECLGGDDGTGVWLMTQLIFAGVPGRYIFHRGEEVGGLGSRYIRDKTPEVLTMGKSPYEGYKRAIAFDRKAKNSIITYQACSRCCSDVFAEELANHLNIVAKNYYLERFQRGDERVMYDVQAPEPEERTAWRTIPGGRAIRTQTVYGSHTYQPAREQYTYTHMPTNEFWDVLCEWFGERETVDGQTELICEFSNEEMQLVVQNLALESPNDMLVLLDAYLNYVDEEWDTDTGGSFTDTDNYTGIVSECTNLSVGYYNAHTQSEYQDYAFLEVFLEGLISTPWEELHTAEPPERDTQTYGYTTYRDTYVPPSKDILATASDAEVDAVKARQNSQKERRKNEREEKQAMQDMFGMDYGDDEWHDAVTIVSSFWDDLDFDPSDDSEYDAFYLT